MKFPRLTPKYVTEASLTFTFTRANSAWFGKYGLNLSYQRS